MDPSLVLRKGVEIKEGYHLGRVHFHVAPSYEIGRIPRVQVLQGNRRRRLELELVVIDGGDQWRWISSIREWLRKLSLERKSSGPRRS
jgi:dissimilatory sulfite reductase (desulfoviridin) alpha/beta subunit